jgi:sialate O-acetylesterase
MCTSAVTVGDKVTVTFSNVGSGLTARGNNNNRLNYFELAGDDGRFFPATAEIQGDKVIVYAPGVRSPRAVRYAWMPFAAKINFYNAEGFPASPFWQECGR